MKTLRNFLLQCLLTLALTGIIAVPSNAETTIYVPVPPPAPKVILKPRSPSAIHIWIPGRWTWVSGKWVWHQGRWIKPPHRGDRWVPGHWKKRHRGWVWIPGHWTRHKKR